METSGLLDPKQKPMTRAMRRNARRRAARSASCYDAGTKPLDLRPATTDIGGRDDSLESETTLVDVSNANPEQNVEIVTQAVNPGGRKYSIEALLSIARKMEVTFPPPQRRRVRFGSEASYMSHAETSLGSPVLGERVMNRRRLSSAASNNSEADFVRVNIQHPIRQPKHAPEGTLAQTHEGFKRFLREHSSPKNHRVTAGGRIVPMDDPRRKPAPEFKLPVVRPSQEGAKALTDENTRVERSTQETSKVESCSQREADGRFLETDNTAFGSHSERMRSLSMPGVTRTTQAPDVETAPVQEHVNPREKESVAGQAQNKQLQLSAEASPFTPTYTNVGGNGQLPSAGPQDHPLSSIPQPVSLVQVPPILNPQLGNQTGIYQAPPVVGPPPVSFNPFNGNQWPNQVPNVLNVAQTGAFPACTKTLEEATEEFNNISAQLSSLDRYLAIHTWDIDAATKKALVAQRIELVHKLDTARQVKEYIEAAPPFSRPGGMMESQGFEPIQQPQYLGMFPGVQAPPFVQNIVQNAPLPGPMYPSFVDFQHTAPPASMFPAPAVGSQLMVPNSFNNGYESHPTGYGFNYQLPTQNMWAPEERPRSGYGVPIRGASTGEGRFSESSGPGPRKEIKISSLIKPRHPEVAKVFRKLEEAERRGESIWPYMEELSMAMERYQDAPKGEKTTMDHYRERRRQEAMQGSSTRTSEFSCGTESKYAASENDSHQSAAQARLSTLHGRFHSHDSRRASVQSRASHGSHSENINPCSTNQHTTCVSIAEEPENGKGKGKANEANETYPGGNGQGQQEPAARRGSLFGSFNFAPWRQRWGIRGSQNGGTTAAQRVNVQGLPPTFDGSASTNSTTGTPDSHETIASKAINDNSTGITSWVSQWYRKAPRKDPNAMDVRAFFQMIRQEDKEILSKCRNNDNERQSGLLW